MEKRKKVLILVTIILAIAAIVLVVTSLATENWVESTPERKNATANENSKNNEVYFGLFKGKKTLDFSFSPRPRKIAITCLASKSVCGYISDEDLGLKYEDSTDYLMHIMSNKSADVPLHELGLFSYGLWVSTIVSAAVSMVFGVVAVGFAVFNLFGKPIETITGPLGLYLWNGLGFVFSLIEVVIFLVLFLTSLSKNFLVMDNDRNSFNVEGHTTPGFSFYLLVVATVLYLVNIILLLCTGYKLKCSFSSEAEKVVDNGVILY